MTSRWAIVLCALAACAKSPPPSTAEAPKPVAKTVAPSRSSAIMPLQCADFACVDPGGTVFVCAISPHQTGRGVGVARTCHAAACPSVSCADFPVLSGEVVNGDTLQYPRMAGVPVTVALADGSTSAVAPTDADGHFWFRMPPNSQAFLHADLPGWVQELHAVHIPPAGWDVPLDMRHFATLANKMPADVHPDPHLGMIVVEFLGLADLQDVRAAPQPPAQASVVFAADWHSRQADRLQKGDRELQVLVNLPPGPVQMQFDARPGVRCHAQVGEIAWPAGPGILTQIDAECAPVP